jgi:hypothetical protein
LPARPWSTAQRSRASDACRVRVREKRWAASPRAKRASKRPHARIAPSRCWDLAPARRAGRADQNADPPMARWLGGSPARGATARLLSATLSCGSSRCQAAPAPNPTRIVQVQQPGTSGMRRTPHAACPAPTLANSALEGSNGAEGLRPRPAVAAANQPGSCRPWCLDRLHPTSLVRRRLEP